MKKDDMLAMLAGVNGNKKVVFVVAVALDREKFAKIRTMQPHETKVAALDTLLSDAKAGVFDFVEAYAPDFKITNPLISMPMLVVQATASVWRAAFHDERTVFHQDRVTLRPNDVVARVAGAVPAAATL